MTTSKPQTSCALCGEPCPDEADRWWPSEYGEICCDCWEAVDEPITESDVEALEQEISLLLLEEFDVPVNPFDFGADFYQLGVQCAERSRN
jgi:hypothetical protein